MAVDYSGSLKSQKEKRSCLSEVSETEKKLWACINSKGVLHNDAKDLYHKACFIHEKLFLSNNELPDLQNIEYLLWRLHYKHIDEFRKIISQSSNKGEVMLASNNRKMAVNKGMVDAHMEGFRLFLSEASKFYQSLIRKIKRFYGLLDEPWFYKNGVSGRIEQTELHRCQFVCHRFCICLGDLARYQELYGKANSQQRNWSVAASYYLEAAKIFPDGGNPQNQLAVLATYIGDECLALYHCIRSLAVKEPFQDALQNLILLFERNRSINLFTQTNEAYDFSKPSEWVLSPGKVALGNGALLNKKTPKVAEHNRSMLTDLWTLVIRTTSFFFIESSFESFPSTFNSVLRELEELLELDVSALSSALESYRNMNLSKAGPYRALHIISVLLFIIHYLTKDPEQKILKPKNEMQQSMLVKLALTVTFTFMGRFIDRCLKGTPVIYFPLLPALLVFVEWLVGAVDEIDMDDEKCDNARLYFFCSFVVLLNQLQEIRTHITCPPDHTALWEDYELRGFVPLSHTQLLLDFSTRWEEEINYKMKNEHRAHRIIQAAIKIAKKPGVSTQKWLFYDDLSRKFSEKPGLVEEEEDIVFTPITRRNSEPIQIEQPKVETPDEYLRRASSLLIAQSRALMSSSASPPPTLSPNPSKYPVLYERPLAAGPPSLSSWVQNGENSCAKTKNRDANRNVLKPIQEVASDDLMRSLSLSTTVCSVPSPSAPYSPRNNIWFINATATHQPVNFSSYPHEFHQESSGFPSFLDHSSPWNGPEFPNLGNHKWLPNHAMQDKSAASRDFNGISNSGRNNYQAHTAALYEDGGPPLFLPSPSLLRGLQDHRQRAKPSASPGISDSKPEPQPLLLHLKERERQLQQESLFTGSPYMQN